MESFTGFEMEKPMEAKSRKRRYSFRVNTIYDSKASKSLQEQRMKSVKPEEDEGESMEIKDTEIQPVLCPPSPKNPLEDNEAKGGNSSKCLIIPDKIMGSEIIKDAPGDNNYDDVPSIPENADVPSSTVPEIGELIMKTPEPNEPIAAQILTVAQTITSNDERIREMKHSGKAFRSATKGPSHQVAKKRSKVMSAPSNRTSGGTQILNTDEEDMEFSRFAYKSTTVFEHSVIIEYDLKREYD